MENFNLNQKNILSYLKSIKPKLSKDGIIKLGLFGSYAKDKNTPYSDVDIVIQTSKDFTDKFIGFKGIIYLDDLRIMLLEKFKTKVDLCDIASMDKAKRDDLLSGVIYV